MRDAAPDAILAGDSRQTAGQEAASPLRDKINHLSRLVGGFWVSREARWPWVLLVVNVAAQFVGVYVSVLSTQYSKGLWDMLGDRAVERLPSILWLLAAVVVATVLQAIVSTLTSELIAFQWRQWLTDRYVGRWLRNKIYYENQRREILDNPDQRIGEDTTEFTRGFLMLVLSLVRVVTMGVTFGAILWHASGSGYLSLGFTTIYLPGHLLLVTTFYMLLQTLGVFYVGRHLPTLIVLGQRFGADFRFKLIQIRTASEQIALLQGEAAEQRTLRERFSLIRGNFYGQILQQAKILAFNATVGSIDDIFPLLLTLPRYLTGELSLGDMMQTQRSMSQYTSTISYFSQAAAQIQVLRGVVRRLRGFDKLLDAAPRSTAIRRGETGEAPIQVQGLTVTRPDGTPLIHLAHWQVESGQRWLIRGPSGVGKSTLLRALAGIWPDVEGRLTVPRPETTLFVPQRTYLPVGTLRNAVIYPLQGVESNVDLAALFARVGLGARVGDLDVAAEWDQHLSPGEQQRLAFLRVLILRPSVVLLDEATSALDPANARRMYAMLLEATPDATIVSIAHTDLLDDLHTHELTLTGAGATIRGIGNDVRTSEPIPFRTC